MSSERKSQSREFWNQKARWNHYVAIYDNEQVRESETREAAFAEAGAEDARRMAWFVNAEMRVLDLGCGAGRVMRHLAPHCRELLGVDISEQMLAEAKGYLKGVENVRLAQTDGASLAGVADGSIGFLYSLLCLIHVDKRSAYRYLQEIRRVLQPGALALLQFQNILTEEGLAKFRSVLEVDYPLEFYTPDEIAWLLRSVDLEVLSVMSADEYLFVTALHGSADSWRADLDARLDTRIVDVSGVFAEEGPSSLAGALHIRIASTLDSSRTFMALLGASSERGETAPPAQRAETSGIVVIGPGRSHDLEFRVDEDGTLGIELDGRPPVLPGATGALSRASESVCFTAGLLPSGFPMNEATLKAFPNLFLSRTVRLPRD